MLISAACCLLFSSYLYAQPQIRISKASWDFGKVREGKILEEILIIENSGDESLKLNIRSSCECISPALSYADLKPRSRVNLKITYDTNGDAGKKSEYIFLDSNDPEHPQLPWLIEGEVMAKSPKSGENRHIEAVKPPVLSVKTDIIVHIFSTKGCRYCLKLKEKIIPKLAEKHNLKIDIKYYPLNEPANYEKLILWEKEYSDQDNKIPVVFVGKKVLGGKKEIDRNLEKELLGYEAFEKKIGLDKNEIDEKIDEKFKSMKLLPILGAGLIDGINPCAFGAIIFLVSYLSVIMKKEKKEVFITGMSFTAGIFVAYFLLGLGLAKILYSLRGFTFFARVLYLLIGLLTLVLAILSFRDYFILKKLRSGSKSNKGEPVQSVSLKLPFSFRSKIFKIMEKHAKSKYFAIFAFFTGMVISGLELVCTGQVYLPTIMYMLQVSDNKHQAIGYLLLYSLMFIIPLFAIFALFYWGVNSQKIDSFGKTHYKTVKLLTTVMFLFLSGYMLGVAFGLF